MAKLSAEHKEEFEQRNYFDEGVHKVKIQSVTLGRTQPKTDDDEGKEFLAFGIISGDGEKEDEVRFWFTTDKAIKYSFNTIKGIFVHNAPEDKKQKTRDALDKIADTEELEKACQNLIGKEAWFSIYQDRTRTYPKQDGTVGYSYNRNLTSYEPTPRAIVTDAEAPVEDVPFESPSDAKPAEGGKKPEDNPFGF